MRLAYFLRSAGLPRFDTPMHFDVFLERDPRSFGCLLRFRGSLPQSFVVQHCPNRGSQHHGYCLGR